MSIMKALFGKSQWYRMQKDKTRKEAQKNYPTEFTEL